MEPPLVPISLHDPNLIALDLAMHGVFLILSFGPQKIFGAALLS